MTSSFVDKLLCNFAQGMHVWLPYIVQHFWGDLSSTIDAIDGQIFSVKEVPAVTILVQPFY